MALKLPRIGIAEIMALVGLVAIDCWAYGFMVGRGPDLLRWILAATLPMANALAIGLHLALKGWARKGPSRPFLAGFVVVGTVSMILAALKMTFYPDGVDVFVHNAFLKPWVVPMLDRAGLLDSSVGRSILITAILACLAAPQFILALAGGLITRHYGIKLAMERRRQASPLPDPSAVSAVS
jgi:hypothetical protein